MGLAQGQLGQNSATLKSIGAYVVLKKRVSLLRTKNVLFGKSKNELTYKALTDLLKTSGPQIS